MPAIRNLAGNANFYECDLRPESLSVIHGNLKSPTSIRTQPSGAIPHLTTDSYAESWYSVMLQARCPLIS